MAPLQHAINLYVFLSITVLFGSLSQFAASLTYQCDAANSSKSFAVQVLTLINQTEDLSLYNEIDCEEQGLTGTIPEEIRLFTNLETLAIEDNELSGSLPLAITNLSALTYLDVSNNALTSSLPSELQNLKNLQYLFIGQNQITGTLPTEVGTLVKLSRLFFDENKINGTLPTQLGLLTQLNAIFCYENEMTGQIPTEFGNMEGITGFSFSNNKYSGPIPTELGRLTRMVQLFLDNNRLTGTIPSEIGNIAAPSPDFSYNRLAGFDPRIGLNTTLKALRLAGNPLNKDISTLNLHLLSAFTNIDLSYTGVFGTLPQSAASSLSNLNALALGGNRFTNAFFSNLGLLTSLTDLDLSNQQNLSGRFPIELAELRNLRTISLSGNKFSGNLPAYIDLFTSLKSLLVGDNKFKGKIPERLWTLTSLSFLDLSQNNFEGTLSTSVGKLTSLQNLTIRNNKLVGQLPEQLKSCRIFALNIGGNSFEGAFPDIFDETQQIAEILIQPNLFTGFMPNFGTEFLFSNDTYPGELLFPQTYSPTSSPTLFPTQLTDETLSPTVDSQSSGFLASLDPKDLTISIMALIIASLLLLVCFLVVQKFDVSIENEKVKRFSQNSKSIKIVEEEEKELQERDIGMDEAFKPKVSEMATRVVVANNDQELSL